jgi:ABC-type Fe3+-hydroxamate transport system substrate-binding protein
MLERFAYWSVAWPLRKFYYPVIRLLGRVTGREELAERLIKVSEENIKRTMDALEGDK